MSTRVPADEIEGIVGVPRQPDTHWGKAVSDEQQVYVLHSDECRRTTPDLRECPFSLSLDLGIDVEQWPEDVPVQLRIVAGRLLPESYGVGQ